MYTQGHPWRSMDTHGVETPEAWPLRPRDGELFSHALSDLLRESLMAVAETLVSVFRRLDLCTGCEVLMGVGWRSMDIIIGSHGYQWIAMKMFGYV